VDTQIVAQGTPVGLVDAVAVLKLLADETRLRIVWNLLHDEHSVNGLAEHLGMQPAAISHHLARLRYAGAVRTRRDGNRIFYLLDDPHIAALVRAALPEAEAPQPDHHTTP
jgi:DNA-binding transcriptional ArsR family regulator